MQGFREAVQTNLSWFEGTKLIVISNTLWVGEKVFHIRVPCRLTMCILTVLLQMTERLLLAGALLDIRDEGDDIRLD